MRRIIWLSSVLVLGCVAPAQAVEPASIQATLQAAGSGIMIANSQTNPSGQSWSWQACDARGGNCAPFAVGQIVNTTGAGSAVVFKATASGGATATSPLWHGNVSALTPPGVTGEVRANALVTPVPGTWTGGWDGDYDATQLAACANANGAECNSLTREGYLGACAHGAAVIDPVFTGWYLFVADRRYSADDIFPAIGYSSPYGGEVWTANAITSVALAGRIAPAAGPRQSSCGAAPIPSARITAASQSTSRWREGAKLPLISAKKRPPVGTTFTFSLVRGEEPPRESLQANIQAPVDFAFTQMMGGRKVGHRCTAKTRKNAMRKACDRPVTVGTMSFMGHVGTNRVVFQGRLSSSQKLKPGHYTLLITASNVFGVRVPAAPKSLSFTIVR